MPLMTLPEYAKGLEKSDIRRPVIETFAASSDIMSALPFEGFSGAAYEYYRESQLTTGMAFRGINEPSTSGLGKIEPFQEPSFPIDHNLDVDVAIVRRHGEDRRAREERLATARARAARSCSSGPRPRAMPTTPAPGPRTWRSTPRATGSSMRRAPARPRWLSAARPTPRSRAAPSPPPSLRPSIEVTT
jgi:hypothetical protein